MPVIVVANPKGGVGKSTLATQIAGFLASRGHTVMLGDADQQQSSRMWLKLRPEGVPPIRPWDIGAEGVVRAPKGTTHVVLDTPAGLGGKRLEEVMRHADKVVVPLQPSLFDIHATHDFLRELLTRRRHAEVQAGIVAMRLKEGTISADQLRHFLGTLDVPVIGQLRDTQNYVHLTARGLTLWDVAPGRVQRDLDQWDTIVSWLQA